MSNRANLKMQLERQRYLEEDTRRISMSSSPNQRQQIRQQQSSPMKFPVVQRTQQQQQTTLKAFKVDQQMSQFGQLRASNTNDYSQSSDNAARTLARRQCLNPGQASAPTRTGEGFHSSTPASPLARLDLGDQQQQRSGTPVLLIGQQQQQQAGSLGGGGGGFDTASNFSNMESPHYSYELAEGGSSVPTIKTELNEDEARMMAKDRQKKDNHNIIERKRRYHINDKIRELGQMVPKTVENDRWNKGSILRATVDYIHRLQKEHERFDVLSRHATNLERLNQILLELVQSYQQLLNEHGIPVPPQANAGELQNLMRLVQSDGAAIRQQQQQSQQQQQAQTAPASFPPPSTTLMTTTSQPIPTSVANMQQQQQLSVNATGESGGGGGNWQHSAPAYNVLSPHQQIHIKTEVQQPGYGSYPSHQQQQQQQGHLTQNLLFGGGGSPATTTTRVMSGSLQQMVSGSSGGITIKTITASPSRSYTPQQQQQSFGGGNSASSSLASPGIHLGQQQQQQSGNQTSMLASNQQQQLDDFYPMDSMEVNSPFDSEYDHLTTNDPSMLDLLAKSPQEFDDDVMDIMKQGSDPFLSDANNQL